MPEDLISQLEHEIADRISRGEQPSAHEYQERYPDESDNISRLFERLVGSENDADKSVIQGEAETLSMASVSSVVDLATISSDGNLPTMDASEPMVADKRSTLPRTFGGYELISEIARGGMGVVYKARQSNLNRLVALKMILAGELAGDAQVQRFYAEAEAAAGLDHPGIVSVFEVGQHDGQHFFSMALIEGSSLSETIREQSLSGREAAKLLHQITEAVAYAHERGVVHRDLKPSNVLIDTSGQPRVTDFGLAKQISGDSEMTASGQIIGTPSYMPPEQAAGRAADVGPPADIYSLGAILYQMLTGRPPFRGTSPIDTVRQVLQDDPVAPSKLSPRLDRDLETICLKCLAKPIGDRYASATALAQELQRYIVGEPITARRIGVASRSLRWCKRRPWQTGLIAASALAIAMLFGFISKSRQAQRVQQVSNLRTAFETQLRSASATEAFLNQMDASIAVLDDLDPTAADDASQKLVDVFAAKVQADLRISDVTVQRERFDKLISLVKERDENAAEELQSLYQKRKSDWKEILHVDGDTNQKVLDDLCWKRLVIDDNGILARKPEGNDFIHLSPKCGTTIEMDVVFTGEWEQAPFLGVKLNASPGNGYTFRLRREGSESLGPGNEYVMEIVRGDNVLLQSLQLSAQELPTGQLHLRARREREQLFFQIGDQIELSFRDVFARSTDAAGQFQLHWPVQATMASLKIRERSLPDQPREIDQADQLLERGEYDAAHQQYRTLASSATEPMQIAEANYKAAVALLKMGRKQDATASLTVASKSNQTPWSLLAECEMWLAFLESNNFAEAEKIQDRIEAAFSIEQVAAAIPQAQRESILLAYFDAGFHAETPEGLRKVERLRSLDRYFSYDGRGHLHRQAKCGKVIEQAGRIVLAKQIYRDLLQRFNNNEYFVYRLSMLARSTENYDEAKRLIDDALQVYQANTPNYLPWSLYDEQLRNSAVMQPPEKTMILLDEFATLVETSDPPRSEAEFGPDDWQSAKRSQVALIRGFLLEELGKPEEAIEVWRDGYLQTRRALGSVDGSYGWVIVNVLVLGSLSDELREDDVAAMVVQLGGNALPLQLVRMGMNQFGTKVVHQSLLKMWQRPPNKRLARDAYAYQSVDYRTRTTAPQRLAAIEFARQTAFREEISADQQRILDIAADGVLSRVRNKEFNMLDILGFATNWQRPGENGDAFKTLVQRLPEQIGGAFSYCVAHRLKTLGRDQKAIDYWLDQSLQKLSSDREFAQMITAEKTQPAAK